MVRDCKIENGKNGENSIDTNVVNGINGRNDSIQFNLNSQLLDSNSANNHDFDTDCEPPKKRRINKQDKQ